MTTLFPCFCIAFVRKKCGPLSLRKHPHCNALVASKTIEYIFAQSTLLSKCLDFSFESQRPESLKAAANSGGTFWTSGKHFGPKFTLSCRICSFVLNHALLTVFLSVLYIILEFCNKNQQDKLNCGTET